MTDSRDKRRWYQISLRTLLIAMLVLGPAIGLGVPHVINLIREKNKSLPTAYYGGTDDVRFFPAGAEFKLDREAAQEKAYYADERARADQLKMGHENTSTK